MYNSFYDVQVGQCSIGVNVNYSIANRFHNFIVGARAVRFLRRTELSGLMLAAPWP